MTLLIGICEDEDWFAQDLKRKTEQYLKDQDLTGMIYIFTSGEELLSFPRNMDIVLMDIKLPGRNGMVTAERLQAWGKRCQIIFITSYRKYVFQAFDIDAVHYILKPVSDEKLSSALNRAVKRADSESGKALLAADKDSQTRVLFREIIFCEVFDHQILVHTMTKEYTMFGTLDSLEKELDSRFFRCHRSYLVNMEFVMDKGDGYADMAGGRRVLISRRRQKEFMKRLLRSCRGERDW